MEITVAEAAAKVGVSTSRIRQWVLDGTITARHLNPRMLMIDAKELAKIPEDRKPGPVAKVRVRKTGRPKKGK